MAIKDQVCGSKGHNLQSLISGSALIPNTTIVVNQFKLVCTQCGRPLDDIQKERTPSPTRTRKPKPSAPTTEPSAPPPNLEV